MKSVFFPLFILLALAVGSCSKDDTPPPTPATFVLVHGSWQGAYTWDAVKAKLEQQGHPVVTVELPAHGNDPTPVAGLTLASYSAKVLAVLDAQSGSVILVGHSMAGMVISDVAEQRPGKVAKLVYVAAYLPQNQQSIQDLSQQDTQSQIGPALVVSPDNATAAVQPNMLFSVFCQDGTPQIQQLLLDKARAEPLAPFGSRVTLTAGNFGRVPKFYLHSLQDRVIGPALQDKMLQATPMQKVYNVNSSHCPQLSQPDNVAAILEEISTSK